MISKDQLAMNNKGSVLHWMVFGMIAAVLFFLLSFGLLRIPLGHAGNWQHTLLFDGFYPAEISQLEEDLLIKEAAFQAAQEAALQGGFRQFGPLGGYEGYQLWNSPTSWADYPLPDALLFYFQEKMSSLRLGYSHENIVLEGFSLLGDTAKKIDLGDLPFLVNTKKKINPVDLQQYYSYSTGFAIDMSDFIQAYNEIWNEAHLLADDCRNDQGLAECLQENLPIGWKHQFCEKSSPFTDHPTRQYSFCVPWKTLTFRFAMDFSPLGVLPIKSIAVADDYQTNAFQIRFPAYDYDSAAYDSVDAYHVYLSSDRSYREKEGAVGELFLSGFRTLIWEKYDLDVSDIAVTDIAAAGNCQDIEKKAGESYHCGQTIIYLLPKEGFAGEFDSYVVTVTAEIDGEESMVRVWEST